MKGTAYYYRAAVASDNERHLRALIEADDCRIRQIATGFAEAGYLIVSARKQQTQLELKLTPV